MKSVLMIEPQGEGGICHYTYCLSQALQADGCTTTLATAQPYELAFAQPDFRVEPVFATSSVRSFAKRLLRRAPIREDSSGASDPSAAKELRPLQGQGGRVSRWLRSQEESLGWRRTLTLAQRLHATVAHIQWLKQPDRELRWLEELRARGVRIVYTAHNVLPHDAPPSTRELWQRVYAACDAIIVHYQQAAQELMALGIKPERYAVIPLGNETAIAQLATPRDLSPGPEAQRRARLELGLKVDAPVALFFGLMRPYKGIEYLLDAFAQVQERLPNARLLLVGRAPDGFAPFDERIRALGIASAVIAEPRYLALSELWRWFTAADVVAAPYVTASQSAVVQLAFAFSRPVIVTQVGGLLEAVQPGATGMIVPPRDSQALADALCEMLSDQARAAAWGQNAYTYAHDHLAWDGIARQTAALYEQVLAAR
jgi:glycosyltransferase involved in cell wall biosynthesis